MGGAFSMKILALEFSSSQRSVAIARRDELRESPIQKITSGTRRARPSDFVLSEIIETGAGTNAPLSMVEEALRQAELEREQVECIALGLGPGSYTGIRSAIALAQGWQLGRGVKLLGISSAQCVAAQARTDGLRGRVCVTIDAQREEFYLATYEISDADCDEVESLRIVTRTELQSRVENGSALIGPEVARWFPSAKTVYPRAAVLCHLALHRTDFIAGEKLEPIYLRETKFVKAPPPRIIS
jgi:tRNA threonylcarbamoyl adenosine modification protein YeaZ